MPPLSQTSRKKILPNGLKTISPKIIQENIPTSREMRQSSTYYGIHEISEKYPFPILANI